MGQDGKKKWRQNFADLFELPRDIIMDLPRLTVIGNLQCFIENHRGVIEYTGATVRLAVNGGEIIIKGSRLVICHLAEGEVALEGNINSISYEF